jgi:chemotaxis response regulator CheB
MPKAAATLNAASEILPLQKIGPRLRELFYSKQVQHIPREEAADR